MEGQGSIFPKSKGREQHSSGCYSLLSFQTSIRKSLKYLKIADYLINVFVRHIGNFLLIINCKQIDTCVCCFYNDVQSDYAKTSSFTATFACNSKSNLSFTAT